MPSTRKRVWRDETPRRKSEATPPGAPVTSTVPPGASWSASRSEVSWRRASSADRKAAGRRPREARGGGAGGGGAARGAAGRGGGGAGGRGGRGGAGGGGGGGAGAAAEGADRRRGAGRGDD